MKTLGQSLAACWFVGALNLLGAQPSASLFDAAIVISPTDSRITDIIDGDGDGFPDAVGLEWDGNYQPAFYYIDFFQNDGMGSLVLRQRLASAYWSSASSRETDRAYRARFSSSPFDDVFVFVDGQLRGFSRPNANSAYSQVWSFYLGPVKSIAVFDYDQDGLTDVAFYGGAVGVQLYRGRLNQPPVLVGSDSSFAWSEGRIIAADVDGAGPRDLAIARTFGTTGIVLVPVLPGGLLGTPVATPLPVAFSVGLTAGDIDNDGDEDLLSFTHYSSPTAAGFPSIGEYRVARRTGPTTFQWEAPLAARPAQSLIDIDMDGDLDGIGVAWTNGELYGTSNFFVSLNQNGVLSNPNVIPAWGAFHLAGVVDLDGNGILDLVAGRSVYLGRVPWAETPVFPVSAAPKYVLENRNLGDFDQDGDLDWGFGMPASNLDLFFTNRGDGTLERGSLTLPPPPVGGAWASPGFSFDVDSDGADDLLLDVKGGGQPTFFIRNAGGGNFEAPIEAIPAGHQPTISQSPYLVTSPLHFGDVDGDGDQDIIRTVWTIGPVPTIQLWRNSGGFFVLAQSIGGFKPRQLVDLNGDGALDLLVSAGESIAMVHSVLRNLGGIFQSTPTTFFGVYFNLGVEPIAADADGDGDLDITTWIPGAITSYVAICRQTAPGIYSLPINLAPVPYGGPQPIRSLVADLDGNGDFEFLFTDGAQTLVFGRIPGTPDLGFKFAIAANPFKVADLDGDGDLDLLGSFRWNNTRFEGPDAGRWRQYGAGTSGSFGFVPKLGALGPFRTGVNFQVRVRGGLGGASGLLLLGSTEANQPFLGSTLLVQTSLFLPITLGGSPGVPGAGALDLPWNLPPNFAFGDIFGQVVIGDPGAPQGISATGGGWMTIGL